MKVKALIIGGGIAGLTLAHLLAGAGLKTAIIDKSPLLTDKDIADSGRTAALMNSSIEIIKATGLWDKIAPFGTPLKQMRLKDDGNPNLPVKEVNFPATEIGVPQFGHNIPNLRLQQALQQALLNHKNAHFMPETGLSYYTVTDSGVTATLDNGDTIEADIIIGCDGRYSKTREIAGLSVNEREYGQSAITCVIDHSKPHDNISTEHHRAGGPFTIVPMKGDQSAIVWVEKTPRADELMALSKDLFEKALQENSHGIVGKITLKTPPQSWPLKTLIAPKLTANRVAIAAEAAHVMSPIGAQGLNLSLRDIAALAETLVDAARNGQDIGSALVLREYENRRKLDIKTRVEGINQFNKVVSNNIDFLRMARRSGLSALKTFPPLKQLIMHQGLAPNMDEGRLMRGEAL